MDRTGPEWVSTVHEGLRIISWQLDHAMEADASPEDRAACLYTIAKEARRLESDAFRIGRDVFQLTREEIQEAGRP